METVSEVFQSNIYSLLALYISMCVNSLPKGGQCPVGWTVSIRTARTKSLVSELDGRHLKWNVFDSARHLEINEVRHVNGQGHGKLITEYDFENHVHIFPGQVCRTVRLSYIVIIPKAIKI